MATGQLNDVLQHLRRTALTDGQLLQDYLSRHDEAALAALVQRHGPMVWGVCRRVLRHYHDAEDAFQATFLVLVRKAASIASAELLANWLYGVAHQTALKARATATKRKAREKQVAEMPEPAVVEQDLWDDLRPLLDQELSRLPDAYRVVIVLCDLEGKTRKEAARQLGLPEGTVGSRLARARALLAKRLTERGVTVSGGALAALLSENVVSASVPDSVADSTIKAASLPAAGKATGAISVKVAALTEGVMQAMSFTKLKATLAVVLILGFVATGITLLACRTVAGQEDRKATAEKPVEPGTKQEKDKEAFTAWGKEINGLQAGLGFRSGEKRVYSHGETVRLVVRVRNVGKEEVKFEYLRQFFIENPPTVTDGEGKPMPKGNVLAEGFHVPRQVTLAPGKGIDLYELKLELRPASESGNNRFSTLYGTGKFQLQYERVLGDTSSGTIKIDPILGKLATGKLELEIKPETPEKGKGGDKPPVASRSDRRAAFARQFDPKKSEEYDHPVWKHFVAIAGDSRASRELFARIISNEKWFRTLDDAEADPAAAGHVYRVGIAEVFRDFDRDPAPNPEWPCNRGEEVAYLLLLGSYPDNNPPAKLVGDEIIPTNLRNTDFFGRGIICGEGQILHARGLYLGLEGKLLDTSKGINPPAVAGAAGTDRVFVKLLAAWHVRRDPSSEVYKKAKALLAEQKP
jgi:RNA polymerase sigma factor (sigma-70 family)